MELDGVNLYLGRGESTQRRRDGTTPRTWAATFAAIEAESKLAANLMRLWAFLHEKDLWHGLFCPADRKSGLATDWLSALAKDDVMFHEALRVLIRFSVAQERVPGSYSLYPATQKWVLGLMETYEKREFEILALAVVGLSVPDDTVDEFWQMRKRLLPHAAKCAVLAKRLGDIGCLDASFCLWKPLSGLGELFVDADWLDKAEQMHKLALGCAEFSGRVLHASSTMQQLGDIYTQNCRLDEAESAYQQATRLYNNAGLVNFHLYLMITVNHGKLYSIQGRYRDAKIIFEEGLALGIKAFGSDHPSTLNIANCLGGFYVQTGVLKAAEKMLMKALTGLNKTFGAHHVHTLNSVNNVGMLYTKQGRLQEAEVMYRHAVEGYEKTCGSGNLHALQTANNLGNLLKKLGRFTEAERIYQDVLRRCTQMREGDCDLLFCTYNNLGTLYYGQRRETEAEKMFILAIKGKSKILGPQHISTLRTAHNLSMIYAEQKHFSRTRHLFPRILEDCEHKIDYVAENPMHSERDTKLVRLKDLFRGRHSVAWATSVDGRTVKSQKWSKLCRSSLNSLRRHTLHLSLH